MIPLLKMNYLQSESLYLENMFYAFFLAWFVGNDVLRGCQTGGPRLTLDNGISTPAAGAIPWDSAAVVGRF